MLPKSFKAGKCKTSLKLAMARIRLMKNKREVQVKQMRRELAQLLESGQEQTAWIRVEHVIREEKTMSAYDLIELYCELIVARLAIIESQKSCPIDLKEAISSVIFASPRCADVPELMDIRKHFVAKYGKEFINSALEVRPDCGVNRMVIEKLSARAPDVETKIKILTAIAQEHNVKWDSKSFEEQLQKPNDDLLNGPNTFASASKMAKESSNIRSSPASTQTNETTMNMSQNDAASKPSYSAHTDTRTPSTSVPFTSQSESRASVSRSGGGDVENSYYREENASMKRPTWNMEFKDATSAAQAAAESAEKASMAARAAVELASRGNMSRQNSTGSNESPTYGKKNDRPDKSRGSKSVPNDELKSSQGVKPEVKNLQKDEVMQGISRREAGSTYDEYSSARKPPSRSSSRSSQTYVNDDILDVSLHEADVKEYGRAQKTMSKSEAMERNRENIKNENVESGRENINLNYNKTTSSHYASTFDDDSIWDSNIRKHGNDGETSTVGAGEGWFFGSGHKQPISSDYSAVVFDDYDSDADDNKSVFGRNKGHLLDPFLPHQGEEPSSFRSNIDPSSPKQHRSGSLAKKSSSQPHLFTESYRGEHSETMTKVTLPSQSNDNVSATFDDSDGLSTESEDEVDNSTHKETMRPGSFLHNQRNSTRGSFSEESGHGLHSAFSEEKREVKETMRNSAPPLTCDGYEENHEADSYSADNFSKRASSSHDNKPSPRNDEAPSNSNDSGRGSGYSSTDEAEPQPLPSSKARSIKEAEAKEQLGIPSSPLGTKDSEISNDLSYESGQGLNYGRLTGGFKNRGFPRPPYVRSSVVDGSRLSKQTSGDTSFITEKPIVSDLQKPSSSFEVPDQERYNQESHLKAYTFKSRTSEASINSHSDIAKGLATHHSDEDAPAMNERQFASHKDKISEDVDVPAQESSYQRSHRKGYKELRTNSPGTYFDPDSNEQPLYTIDSRRYRDSASTPPKESSDASPDIDKLTASHPNKTLASSEVLSQELYDKKPRVKALKESSTRRPVTYFDSDGNESKLDSHYTPGSRVNTDVKLSRRTRGMPSESKKSSFSRFTGRSDMPLTSEMESRASQASSPAPEPLSNTTHDAINIQGKGSSKALQPNPSAEQPSVAPMQTFSTREESPKLSQLNSTERIVPANNGNTKPSSSSGGSALGESSLKYASHTHPKLPDYESLAAHFQSLRSNRR